MPCASEIRERERKREEVDEKEKYLCKTLWSWRNLRALANWVIIALLI